MTYVGGPYDGHAEWERPALCVDGHQRFIAIGELAYVYVARGGQYVFAKAYRPAREQDDDPVWIDLPAGHQAGGESATQSDRRAVLHSVVECDPRGVRE
jgi:hypothetical protein